MGFSFGIRKLSRCQSQEGEDCHGVLGFHLRLGDEDQDLVICQDVENSVPNLIHPSLHVQEEKTETIPLLVSRSFWRTHWMIHDDSVSNNINNGQKVHPISSSGFGLQKSNCLGWNLCNSLQISSSVDFLSQYFFDSWM